MELSWIVVPREVLVDWTTAAAVAAVAIAALLFVRRQIRSWFGRMAATEKTELMELPTQVLSRTTAFFIVGVSIWLGLQFVDLRPRWDRAADGVIKVLAFWQAGVWVTAAAFAVLDRRRRQHAEDRAILGSLGIVGFVLRVVIWAVVVLVALDNLGVDITALVAGLGIGGVAVALAVQNVLGDLLASLSITLDKPFVVGDFVVLGDFMGSVEYVGIKSTRLRSLSGEQIVMSNADLLSSRLRNFGRMAERRVVFTLSVTYETPQEKLEQLPAVIRRVVEHEERVRFDRSHFSKYGASSLDFETVYYVKSPDFNVHMDIQQRIYFALMREFRDLGVEFAYPTQKVWLQPAEGGAEPWRGLRSEPRLAKAS